MFRPIPGLIQQWQKETGEQFGNYLHEQLCKLSYKPNKFENRHLESFLCMQLLESFPLGHTSLIFCFTSAVGYFFAKAFKMA